MKALVVRKFLTIVSVNHVKAFFSNNTKPISSHSVNSVVAYNDNFLSNNFPINPTIPFLSPKPTINRSIKSIIPLDPRYDDISTHKSEILGIVVTPRADSTVPNTSKKFSDTNSLPRFTEISLVPATTSNLVTICSDISTNFLAKHVFVYKSVVCNAPINGCDAFCNYCHVSVHRQLYSAKVFIRNSKTCLNSFPKSIRKSKLFDVVFLFA